MCFQLLRTGFAAPSEISNIPRKGLDTLSYNLELGAPPARRGLSRRGLATDFWGLSC